MLAAIDAVLLVVSVLRVADQLRIVKRREAKLDAALADHGVDVTVMEPVVDNNVLVAEMDGGSLRSTGFSIAIDGAVVNVPRGTPVSLGLTWIVRDDKYFVPADARLRALVDRAPSVDDGPLRTSSAVTIEGTVTLATPEPELRARSTAALSWSNVVIVGAAITFAVLLASWTPWFASLILIVIGIGLASDFFLHLFIGSWVFVRERVAIDDDGEAVVRKVAAGVGFVMLAIGLSMTPVVMPSIQPWTLRHAEIAPADRIDPELEGQIVVVTGPLDSSERVTDRELLRAGNELVLERSVQIGTWALRPAGRHSTYRYGWSPGSIEGYVSQSWKVSRLRIGAYEFSHHVVVRPVPIEKLSISADRVLRPSLGKLRWDAAASVYRLRDRGPDEHPQLEVIEYSGLTVGTRVSVLGRQRGTELVPISDASDGTSGLLVFTEPPPHGETVADEWPDDESFVLCAFAVALGLCCVFMRPLHLMSAVLASFAICLWAMVSGEWSALFVVPIGLFLVNFPLSIPIAVASTSMLAAPIAIMRATESVELSLLCVVPMIALTLVVRRGFGWHRSLGWKLEST